ncbi:hypothetical protein OC844_006764, partial [Tilletia horrida]
MLPSCAADYGGDGTELELGSFGVAVDIDDKYPLWRCQLTRMTLVRRLYHFFDWVAVFAAKFDETDDSSKPDIISFLRILDDAGSSKMLDAHSSMNVQIKRYGDVYHSGNAPSDAQEGASSAARGVADDVAQDEYQNAASASSASVHSMNTSTVCPEDEPLQGCHINIVEDAPPCPAASASSASSANRPKSKRRYGVANARKLSGSGQ